MADPGLNNLLKWGIANSEASRNDETASKQPPPAVDAAALQRLMSQFSGPSDAQLMVESMAVIENPEAELEHKVVAFENFEMLVESIDNANNLESLGLWTRLVDQFDSPEPELRLNAAWCCGVAVQNNIKSQERLLILGAIPTIIRMATTDVDKRVRKKAILALSSAIRNFQPGLDAAVPKLPAEFQPEGALDADDMDSVDSLINKLRESV